MNLSMSFSMNNNMKAATPTGAPAVAGAAPAQDVAVAAIDPLLAGALPATPPAALPFQQWIGLDPAPLDATPGAADPPASADDATATPDSAENLEQPAETMLLSAMSSPLLAANLPSAMPAMMMAMTGARLLNRAPALDSNTPAATTASASGAAPAAAAAAARAPVDALALPVATVAPAAAVRTDAAATVQAPAAATTGSAAGAPLADTSGADSAAIDAAPTGAAVAVAATPASTTRAGDTLALAGPPTAWRQTLQEALGERLQMQTGRGVEQATIRLEPPMLGRIDIAIRHSGGNLEVHIAASNSEVMRQLSGVSDALRNDLAGRQFSSVSLSVSETPRAQAGAQTGTGPGQNGQPGADAQNRGRQPGQEQRTPGLALNDAGDAGSLFSMNGRD